MHISPKTNEFPSPSTCAFFPELPAFFPELPALFFSKFSSIFPQTSSTFFLKFSSIFSPQFQHLFSQQFQRFPQQFPAVPALFSQIFPFPLKLSSISSQNNRIRRPRTPRKAPESYMVMVLKIRRCSTSFVSSSAKSSETCFMFLFNEFSLFFKSLVVLLNALYDVLHSLPHSHSFQVRREGPSPVVKGVGSVV